MRLGAQVYSVRKDIQTPEGYLKVMQQLKQMGYETIQHAGTVLEDPYLLRDLSQQAGLQQLCPNIRATPLLENPKGVIDDMRILGCDSIMLPYITPDDFVTLGSFLEKWAPLENALQTLQDAGITPCYHNHDFDIAPLSDWDGSFVDYLFENRPGWNFILDVCWSEFAQADTCAYLCKLAKRMDCVHFKDYGGSINSQHVPVFTACGNGSLPLPRFANLVKELGIRDVIVEQDNAQSYPDPMGQMAQSAAFVRSLF